MSILVRIMMICLLIVAAGCGGKNTGAGSGTQVHTIIDWVDFVKLNGVMYTSIYSGVIADSSLVSDNVVGKVTFNVNNNVHNPSYNVKDGDAAFLAEGTELYEIEGLPRDEYIAAKDENAVNGYRVYYVSGDKRERTWHFKDLEQEKVEKIEVYKGHNGSEKSAVYEGDAVKPFLRLLNESQPDENYRPQTAVGDPIAYQVIFYDRSPIAQYHYIFKDDAHYYWSPWNTNIIDDEIADYIEEQK